MRCMYAGSKPYPLQDTFCRSVTVGAVNIVEAQKHTFVRCWFKGTIIKTVPLPLRPTEAVDMIETQREFSRAHAYYLYWLKKPCPFPGCVLSLPLPFNGSCRLGRSAVTQTCRMRELIQSVRPKSVPLPFCLPQPAIEAVDLVEMQLFVYEI